MNDNHRKALSKDFRFIILLIGLCSLVGLFWRIFPLLDLFNHFRVQAVAGSAFCAAVFLILKNRNGFLISLAVLAFNASIVGYRLSYTGGIPALSGQSKASFSIVSSNVLTENTDYMAVLDMAHREDPDLIVFSETDDTWISNLKALEKDYPYHYAYPRPDNFGLAAYSKKPFKAETRLSSEASIPILKLEYAELTVLVVHPLPPASVRNMNSNMAYLSDAADMMEKDDSRPVLIAGDMNSTLWSGAVNSMVDLGFSRINPLGLAYTWPVRNFAWMLQIDHFFGRNIAAGDFEVLPSVGSDHYPIRADIMLAPKAHTSAN